MGLARYAKAAETLALEVIGDVTEADINQLRTALRDESLAEWLEWLESNNLQVLAFLRATPAQRSRSKVWQANPARWALACWRAYRQSAEIQLAVSLQTFAPGGSYRHKSADVLESFEQLQNEIICAEVWPPYWGDYPFLQEGTEG